MVPNRQALLSAVRLFIYTWTFVSALETTAMAVLTNYANRAFMSCGAEHALVLKPDGTVWVWGNNSHSQQFGGAVPPRFPSAYSDPDGNDFDFNPARVPEVLGGVAVAAGSYHSLVLKYDGTVLAWGENGNGQLGVGDVKNKGTPILITNLSSVVAIAGGEDFSMAVLQNGAVKSWGHNPSGVLGIGTASINRSTTPTNVLALTNAVAVACGYQHALALDSNGTVWGWGDNGYGEVGDGSTGDRYASALYREQLQGSGLIASMSRRGNCYDNAAMEAFWSTLKREALEQSATWSKDRVRREIFEYIEAIYNRKRLHSSLGYKSPVDYETTN